MKFPSSNFTPDLFLTDVYLDVAKLFISNGLKQFISVRLWSEAKRFDILKKYLQDIPFHWLSLHPFLK